jgi:glycine dehydrogenase subunit 2
MNLTIYEKSQQGQHAYSLPRDADEFQQFHPPQEWLRRLPLPLPEISEIDLTRHFSKLAQRNMGIDTNFYPLGSCTMKLNPRVNELCANMTGFTRTHPLAPADTVQGNLRIIVELIEILCDLSGMQAGSLVPNAGAQGEFAGIRMISAYHMKRKDHARTEILVPDNAHGTNPATAAMAGYTIVPIRTNAQGDMDLDYLRKACSEKTAGLMLTNPNTLGLFSPVIVEIAEIVHEKGGLLYYDGANLNPLLYIARPGDMGFDVMHINLHKTFSTPHGGGGPGAAALLCGAILKDFLPVPQVIKQKGKYDVVWNHVDSIGSLASFHGNFGIYLRAYLYARLHGKFGLRKIAEQAVLNANYLKHHLSKILPVPFPQPCMHEFVIQADSFLDKGVRALDIAKRLIDYGIHPPTIYFPLIIKECLLVEPTEAESKDTLDHFIEVIKTIVKEIQEDPELVKTSPHRGETKRLDETQAAKHPIFKHPLENITESPPK